ncbi:MAG: ATP-dependent DNA helicase RecG [Pseudomonadota bacterium]
MSGEAQRARPAPAPALPGLTKATASRLAKLGILRERDLILHLPLRYEDETRITPIGQAAPGEPVQIEAEVVEASVHYRPRRQLVARVRDASGELVLRFLNFYPSQQKALAPGRRLRIFGEIRGGFFGAEMIHPRYRSADEGEPLPAALTPVYPTTAGLPQTTLRRLIAAALERSDLSDTLPEALGRELGLPTFAEAVRLLHHPPPDISLADLAQHAHPAWRRIKFDELLAQQLSLRRAYRARRAKSAPPLPPRHTLTAAFLTRLPFRLTGAQERAWAEISADLAQAHPMQRLLQGDVGSGKTVVAALAMLRAAEHGWQAALMAPTEILAEQHYRKLAAWLAPLGLDIAWLAGSLKKAEKSAMAARIASGEVLLAVGTHALIEEAVDFPRLGLAIVDEQHRFGVRQRLALREKGASPHQLMMSATPIPRTLAMSYYADLDVSLIDELPPGRTPVLTKLVSDGRRDEVIRRVREACAAGRQAYWVCPLIDESEALQLQTALETWERLRQELPELRVGLVHGRLSGADKAQVMAEFAAGNLQLLVATTVIEVGVDVPNASLMVIEHAERFGLAQLHQLRGRVGRGTAESACILLYGAPLSQTARARLKIIYENSDGFEIARQDLLLRGPGEFIGSRQSGLPLLRFADLTADQDLLEHSREAAERLLRDDPAAAERHTARWLGGRADYLKV